MATLKSAEKRILVNEKKRTNNQKVRSTMRTHVKRVNTLINENNVEEAQKALKVTIQQIDKAVQKGVIHKNNGTRKKTLLIKKVNQLSA